MAIYDPYPVYQDDVESRWRALDDSESAIVDQLLTDAGLILDGERPLLHDAYDAGKVPLPFIAIAMVRAVKRVLSNLDEVKGQQIGADGSVQVNFNTSSTATQTLSGIYYLTSDLTDIDRALSNAGVTESGSSIVTSTRLVTYATPAAVDLTANLPTA